MRLKFLAAFALFFIFCVFVQKTQASSDFDISAYDKYQIATDGLAKVDSNVVITNKTKYTYTPTYTVGLTFSDISDLKATSSAGLLKSQIIKSPTTSLIQVTFPKKNIGIGNKNSFTITYSTRQVAKNKKSGWEVVIPGLSDPKMFSNYSVDVTVPAYFGYAAIVTPIQKSEQNHTYEFKINDFSKSGIYMLFKNDPSGLKEKLSAEFPKNALFGFPVKGTVNITNSTGETIANKTLNIESESPLQSVAYEIKSLKPYETQIVGVDLGAAPFLTLKKIKVKISFDGRQTISEINVGFLPDYYILFLGGLIFGGSLIVATVAVKTLKSIRKS